ncbi:uncharacterized protein LOC133907958 [Phragmites australis]|uniref:uncharacterized protein LOC133907958 n=1 Tax=Phragmites australis TaxID=29695 RepID=UPI002D79373F|nr:uncharacterized protein LOC133907958 [Phragmites australis]
MRRHRAARATMTTPPPPQLPHPSPQDQVDDLTQEILLRIPPYKPKLLVRCSAVCKPWRLLLTDPAFLRRYRAFHRVPPMLGFLFNLDLSRDCFGARFVRTTPFRPRTLDHGYWYARDSRHGRVLFRNLNCDPDLVVWNPITDERWGLPLPVASYTYWDATVLCAAAAREGSGECDHLDCHGGPFLVAFVGTNDEDGITCACVYSSETAAWSDATVAEHPEDLAEMDMKPAALVGNTIYCLAAQNKTIVEYDLGSRQLAFIDPPFAYEDRGVLMPAAGGGLGFAGVKGSCLYLLSREVIPDRSAAWTQRRVIELNTLPTGDPFYPHTVVGFAAGLGVIFVTTDAGVFAINLNSCIAKKVSNRGSIDTVIPYISFYTPDHATG